MKNFIKKALVFGMVAVVGLGTFAMPSYAAGNLTLNMVDSNFFPGSSTTTGTDSTTFYLTGQPSGWYRVVARGGGTTTIQFNGTNYTNCMNGYWALNTANPSLSTFAGVSGAAGITVSVTAKGGYSILLEKGTCAQDDQDAGTFQFVDIYTCTNGSDDTYNHPRWVIMEFNENLSQANGDTYIYPFASSWNEYITVGGVQKKVYGMSVHNNKIMLQFSGVNSIGSGVTFTNPTTITATNFYLNEKVNVKFTNKAVAVKNNCGDFSTQTATNAFRSILNIDGNLDRQSVSITPKYEVDTTNRYTSTRNTYSSTTGRF